MLHLFGPHLWWIFLSFLGAWNRNWHKVQSESIFSQQNISSSIILSHCCHLNILLLNRRLLWWVCGSNPLQITLHCRQKFLSRHLYWLVLAWQASHLLAGYTNLLTRVSGKSCTFRQSILVSSQMSDLLFKMCTGNWIVKNWILKPQLDRGLWKCLDICGSRLHQFFRWSDTFPLLFVIFWFWIHKRLEQMGKRWLELIQWKSCWKIT